MHACTSSVLLTLLAPWRLPHVIVLLLAPLRCAPTASLRPPPPACMCSRLDATLAGRQEELQRVLIEVAAQGERRGAAAAQVSSLNRILSQAQVSAPLPALLGMSRCSVWRW